MRAPPAPALFGHCCDIYNIMLKESKPTEVHDGGKRVAVQLWEGYLTKLFKEKAGLSVPYYTSVMNMLVGMDCVRQVRRGGGGAPSQWAIVQTPTIELFNAVRDSKVLTRKKRLAGPLESMAQMVRDLQKRVDVLEQLHAAELKGE